MLETSEITYRHGNITFRAYVAMPASQKQPAPCVMIAPDWSGRTERACKKAEQLAALGYVGIALDLYGDATTADTNEARQSLMNPILEQRSEVIARMRAALEAASSLDKVNHHKIAVIGYCFGGLCALDLARSGAPIQGAVSFHGLLMAPDVALCQKIKAKILVLHGYDDPMVKPANVNQFAAEMTAKKADWQIHMYGHTQHAFTNPLAHDHQLGLCYNEKADRRSWASTELFLQEIFSSVR